jgi:IS5 family transposase
VLIFKRAQKPLPIGGICGNDVHIWNTELSGIDRVLCDEEFLDILRRAYERRVGRSKRRGAPRMALNRLLRTQSLKHLKNWSFRDLFNEVQRNLDYRAFSQFFDEPIRSVATLSRNCGFVDAQAVRELNERLCQLAREQQVVVGKVFRQDTTVSETNIHHPTDSSLMQDGCRVLQRLAQQAVELVPSLGKLRDCSRAVLHRVLEINRAARSRQPEASERMSRSYCALLRITRSVATQAERVAEKLGDGRVTRHLGFFEQLAAEGVKQQLETMLPRVDQVLRQTRARIHRGITNYPDKILSLFVPDTSAIRKGKPHKPTEFGRLIEIVEVEKGFVSDYRVHQGNPEDGTLLVPALERHQERFGRVPRHVATDRGFWSAANEQAAYALGVKRVSIPARGKLSAVRCALQRSRWFRALQRWRANGEGRIATLKHRYGLDRCMYKGEEAMERWVGWCVFANNLTVVARNSRAHAHAGGQDDQAVAEEESCSRAAA